MFYDNYIRLCAQKKKSPSAVAKEIGLSNAAANGWKRGKFPNDTTLSKLSSYFDVPVSELTSEAKKESPPQGGEPNEKDMRIIRWFHSLPPETRKAILTLGGGPIDLAE